MTLQIRRRKNEKAGLSIVIPVFNREKLIDRTLKSLSSQTVLPDQIILVDNGSSDSSLPLLQEWGTRFALIGVDTIVKEEPRPGAARARNTGLEEVKTEWVMFFDSDDEMGPDHIKSIKETIEANACAKIIGWNVKFVIPGKAARIKPFAEKDALYMCVLHGAMATQRYAVKTDLIKKVGGWAEDLDIWDDIELGCRLLKSLSSRQELVKISKRAPGAEVIVHVHPCSITGASISVKSQLAELAIDKMERVLSPNEKWIAQLKRAVLCGLYIREKAIRKKECLLKRMENSSAAKMRLLCKGCAFWTGLGLPGASRIARIFMPKTSI